MKTFSFVTLITFFELSSAQARPVRATVYENIGSIQNIITTVNADFYLLDDDRANVVKLPDVYNLTFHVCEEYQKKFDQDYEGALDVYFDVRGTTLGEVKPNGNSKVTGIWRSSAIYTPLKLNCSLHPVP